MRLLSARMFGPANQRLPPTLTHCSRRGADGPEKGFVPSTPKIPDRRGERTFASTTQTGRELLAARVRPALAQMELLPFSPSTPQRTTCRGALPLADKNMRRTRRKISSPPASPARLDKDGDNRHLGCLISRSRCGFICYARFNLKLGHQFEVTAHGSFLALAGGVAFVAIRTGGGPGSQIFCPVSIWSGSVNLGLSAWI